MLHASYQYDDKFDLIPNDSHKSFYGKARVLSYHDGVQILISYETPVIACDSNGNYFRLWNGWSATTGRHIRAFSGLSKHEYFNLTYPSQQNMKKLHVSTNFDFIDAFVALENINTRLAALKA